MFTYYEIESKYLCICILEILENVEETITMTKAMARGDKMEDSSTYGSGINLSCGMASGFTS
jgi:hypothetical protein